MEGFVFFVVFNNTFNALTVPTEGWRRKADFHNPPQVWHCIRRSVTDLQNYLLSLNILLN